MGSLKNVLKTKEDSARVMAAELARLEAKHTSALERQWRIAEQQDTLYALKQEVSEASSEEQLAAIRRKEEA
jgi:hypothetical protein